MDYVLVQNPDDFGVALSPCLDKHSMYVRISPENHAHVCVCCPAEDHDTWSLGVEDEKRALIRRGVSFSTSTRVGCPGPNWKNMSVETLRDHVRTASVSENLKAFLDISRDSSV